MGSKLPCPTCPTDSPLFRPQAFVTFCHHRVCWPRGALATPLRLCAHPPSPGFPGCPAVSPRAPVHVYFPGMPKGPTPHRVVSAFSFNEQAIQGKGSPLLTNGVCRTTSQRGWCGSVDNDGTRLSHSVGFKKGNNSVRVATLKDDTPQLCNMSLFGGGGINFGSTHGK